MSTPMEMMKAKALLIALFFLGAAVRAVDVWRNVDGSVRDSWRECDVAAVARNYYREGMNLSHPRIDWRGTGPGYAEMEFPLFPWLIAAGYKIFGFHEVIGRLISYSFSVLALFFFFKLSVVMLPPLGALTAGAFFALSPMLIRIATSLQPEGLMFLAYVIAAYAFVRWVDSGSRGHYALALAATSLAVLAKASAAHIWLIFLLVLVYRKGLGALKSIRVWLFFVLSVIPPALWYFHAHHLWEAYGNSLGVSNQYHWPDAAIFRNAEVFRGLLRTEVWSVWMPSGAVLALSGLLNKANEKTARTMLLWLLTLGLFYVAIANTASKGWAYYYHVFSVLPAAIVLGLSAELISRSPGLRKLIRLEVVASIVIGAGLMAAAAIGLRWHLTNSQLILAVATAGVAMALAAIIPRMVRIGEHPLGAGLSRPARAAAALILLAAIPSTFLFQSFLAASDMRPRDYRNLYDCSRVFAPHIPEGALILVSGGNCLSGGHPSAYDTPYFFYWLDKKGFSICGEEHTIDNLASYASRGVRFFVAERSKFARFAPGFESELRQRFRTIAECDEALLIDISSENPRT